MSATHDDYNPFHFWAWMELGFSCDACRAELRPSDSEIEADDGFPSDEWCASFGDRAERAGWWIAPEGHAGRYSFLCPEHRDRQLERGRRPIIALPYVASVAILASVAWTYAGLPGALLILGLAALHAGWSVGRL